MTPPLISVIVPIYNAEPWLRKCLDSIVNQTYTNLEIILVDDGSPDACGAICDDYAAKDTRIRVIHQQNIGLSGARNVGIEIATGDLMFVDADDWIDCTLCEKLMERALATDAGLVQCRVDYVCEDGSRQKSHVFGPDGLESVMIDDTTRAAAYDRFLLGEYIWDCAWGRLYCREAIEQLRFVDTALVCNEDFLFTLCLFIAPIRVEIVQEPLYFYRQRGDSLTRADAMPHRIACRPRLFAEFDVYMRNVKVPTGRRKRLLGAAMHHTLLNDAIEAWHAENPALRDRALAAFEGMRKQRTFRRLARKCAFARPLDGKGLTKRLHRALLLLGFAYGGTFGYLTRIKILDNL